VRSTYTAHENRLGTSLLDVRGLINPQKIGVKHQGPTAHVYFRKFKSYDKASAPSLVSLKAPNSPTDGRAIRYQDSPSAQNVIGDLTLD